MLTPGQPASNITNEKINFLTFEPYQKVLDDLPLRNNEFAASHSLIDEVSVNFNHQNKSDDGKNQLGDIDTDLQDYQKIQRNLEEAVVNFLAGDDNDDPYRIIIKPIKINSPVEKLLCEYTTEIPTIPRGKSKAAIFERESYLQKTVSPRRKSSITSMECISEHTLETQRNNYNCKSPFYEERHPH